MQQYALFGDPVDDAIAQSAVVSSRDTSAPDDAVAEDVSSSSRLVAGRDVRHPEFGHGWVQGSGHGVVTVRFETRTTGPGRTRTFAVDDPLLTLADPLDSLEWPGVDADTSH